MRFIPSILTIFAASIMGGPAFTQPATPAQMAGVPHKPGLATMHMKSKLGSFRIVDAVGRLEVDFSGTMLISQLKGTAVPSAGLRKEYDANGRRVYFGKGKMVITGSWRGVQWFGTDMSAVWYGAGLARLSGEFDKDLNTGEYWFSDPTRREYWLSSGSMTVILPSVLDVKKVIPIERNKIPPKKSGG